MTVDNINQKLEAIVTELEKQIEKYRKFRHPQATVWTMHKKASEELSELAQALAEGDVRAICEEAADVALCLQILLQVMPQPVNYPTSLRAWMVYKANLNDIRMEQRIRLPDQPEIVTICGSTKFKEEFMEAANKLTEEGRMFFTCGTFSHADTGKSPEEHLGVEGKAARDDLHKRKIDASEAIYVVSRDGYFGSSTKSEIDYAILNGKRVEWLEEKAKQRYIGEESR